MMKGITHILLFGLLLLFEFATAQEKDTTLLGMQERYAAAKSMEMELEMVIHYDSEELEDIAMNGVLKSSTNGYFSILNHQIVVMNENNWLVIDQQRKSMVYNAYEDEALPATQLLDSTIWGDAALTFTGYTAKGKVYRFDYPPHVENIPYAYALYTISDDFLIKEIAYFYRNMAPMITPQKVVVAFKNIKLNAFDIPEAFSVTPYLSRAEGKAMPIGPYADYELIDMTKKNTLYED